MRIALMAAAVAASIGVADAADDPFVIAFDLGTVIGSEEACGLAFSQSAIEAFIERAVAAADMKFMDTMNGSARLIRSDIEDFPASQKAAHCAQVRRVAKAHGFID